MKYIYQLLIILSVTFVGELLHYFIPLPVPASIYGLLIMLLLLCTRIIRLEQIEKVSDFLLEIMPLMFIPGGVGLITVWADLKPIIVPVSVITVLVTVIVMVVTGKSAELIMRLGRRRKSNEQHND